MGKIVVRRRQRASPLSVSGGCRGSGPGPSKSARAQLVGQQVIVNPIPGPPPRPFALPVDVPARFQVPESQLLAHQVKSGIDVGNLFKLLNSLQSRIAYACAQHQYLRDPANHRRPPDDGGYRPLTAQAAVRDLRSLCRQQQNLMEKLRRWNCINEGSCYNLIMNKVYTDICSNCKPFATSKIRNAEVVKLVRKRVKATRRKEANAKKKAELAQKQKVIVAPPAPPPLPPPPPPPPPPVTRRRIKRLCSLEQPHPEAFLSQESFLSQLGLVTPEVYKIKLAESKRTERRRRTTANPKYRSSVFVDPTETGRSKRSRRSDPESLKIPDPPVEPSRPGNDRRRAQHKRYECSVCEQKDVNVTCNRCMSGFHADCIRVSASKATIPPTNTVAVCPNCVPCNPNIKSSDCILLSRKICRPSIMGIGPADPIRPRAAGRKGGRGRPPKQTSKSKAAFKPTYAKRGRPPLNSRKPVASPSPPPTPTPPSSSSSRRTLNHSSAVAAAAAVPAACCTSPRSSTELTTTPEKVEPPVEVNKRVVPPVGIKWNTRHAKLRGGERRRPYPKRDISPPPPITTIKYEGTSPRRPVKVAPLFGTDENVTAENLKQSAKIKALQESTGNYQHKSVLTNSTFAVTKVVTVKRLQTSVKIPNVVEPKIVQHVKTKTATMKTEGENIKVAVPPIIATKPTPKATPNKPTPGPSKKGNSQKSRPIDAFAMKRTMMAMSAAAGLVMSNNGIKLASSSPSGASAPIAEIQVKPEVAPELPASSSAGASKSISPSSAPVFARKSLPLPIPGSPIKPAILSSLATPMKTLATSNSMRTPSSAAASNSMKSPLSAAAAAASNSMKSPLSTAASNSMKSPLSAAAPNSMKSPLSAASASNSMRSPFSAAGANSTRTLMPATANSIRAQISKVSSSIRTPLSAASNSMRNPLSTASSLSSKANAVAGTAIASKSTASTESVSKYSFSPSTNIKKVPEAPVKVGEVKHGKKIPLSATQSKCTQPGTPVKPEPSKYGSTPVATNKVIRKPAPRVEDMKCFKNFHPLGDLSTYTPSPATPCSSKSLYSSFDIDFPTSTSTYSSYYTGGVPPAIAGPSGLHLKSSSILNQTQNAKKKRTYPLKPAPRLDPILEQTISDSISSAIAAAVNAPPLTLDSDDDTDDEDYMKYLKKTTSAPSSTELSESTADAAITARGGGSSCTNTSKFNDKPPKLVQEKLLEDYNLPSCRNYVMDGKNATVDRPVSPVSDSSTIGSSRSVRDDDDDSSEDLLSIPDASLSPLALTKKRIIRIPPPPIPLPPSDPNEPYWTDDSLSSFSASAGSSRPTAGPAKKPGRKTCY